jgi:uncharacterized protein
VSLVYIDTSALVKLFKPEAESEALAGELEFQPDLVSSELIVVEALCTAKRLDDPTIVERAALALDSIGLIPFTERIRNQAAARRFEPSLRTLDSIHLSTALSLGDELSRMLAYDDELCRAAEAEGLRAEGPR